MSDDDVDQWSWKARCNRYFTSLTDDDAKDNKDSRGDNKRGRKSGEKETWKSLSELKRQTKRKRNYFQRTLSVLDIHGARFCSSVNSGPELIVGLVIILGSVAALVYLVCLKINDYNSETQRYETRNIETFPSRDSMSVSFCNRNILKKSLLNGTRFSDLTDINLDTIAGIIYDNTSINSNIDVIKNALGRNEKLIKLLTESSESVKSTIYTKLSKDIITKGLLQTMNMSVPQYLAVNGKSDTMLKYLQPTMEEMRILGHKAEDMLVKCFLERKECDTSELVEVTHGILGNCLTIKPSNLSKPGNLEVILDVESNDYLDVVASSTGVFVIVHQSELTSTSTVMKSSTHTVSPNTHIHIDVTEETVITRRTDTCSAGKDYNKEMCLNKCADDITLDICGCRTLVADENQSFPVCRNDVLEDYLCLKAVEEIQKLGGLKCHCPQKCSESLLTMKPSVLTWPSEQHIKHLHAQLRHLKRNSDLAYIRDNLVKISVTLRPQIYQEIKEVENKKILDLLGVVGGLSALLVGVSILTLVELLWLVIKAIFDLVRECCRRNDVKKVERLSDSEITSITWAMHRQQRKEEEKRKGRENRNESKNTKTEQHVFTGNALHHITRRNNFQIPVTDRHAHIYANTEDTIYGYRNRNREALPRHRQMSESAAYMHRHGSRHMDIPHYEYTEPSHPRLMHMSHKPLDLIDNSRSNMIHLEDIYRPPSHQIYYERVTYPHMGRIVTPADAIQLYGGQYVKSNHMSEPVYTCI